VTRERLIRCLEFLMQRLRGVECQWAITGGSSLLIREIQSSAHDIDILATKDCAVHFSKRFTDITVTKINFSEADNVRSIFARYIVHGIVVEVMADVSNRLADGEWHPNREWTACIEHTFVDDFDIPVLTLDYEKQIALMLGQNSKASRIEGVQRNTY